MSLQEQVATCVRDLNTARGNVFPGVSLTAANCPSACANILKARVRCCSALAQQAVVARPGSLGLAPLLSTAAKWRWSAWGWHHHFATLFYTRCFLQDMPPECAGFIACAGCYMGTDASRPADREL